MIHDRLASQKPKSHQKAIVQEREKKRERKNKKKRPEHHTTIPQKVLFVRPSKNIVKSPINTTSQPAQQIKDKIRKKGRKSPNANPYPYHPKTINNQNQ